MYLKLLMAIFVISMFGTTGCKEKINQQTGQSKGPSTFVAEQSNDFSNETEIRQIQWIYSLSEGLKSAKEKDKSLLVVFEADWCGWCKKFTRETFADSKVIELSYNFVPIKVNTDKNPADARKYKVTGLPTVVFLKPDGEIIEKIIGYRDSNDFVKIMLGVIKK